MAKPTIKHRELVDARKWFYQIMAEQERLGDIITTEETITPARATAILEHNHNNRPLKPQLIEKYASDMKENRWQRNGENIIISEERTLNTGQHRLSAVIKAGVSVVMNLCRGVKRETMQTVDTGKSQSTGDKATMNGFKYGSVLASVGGAVIAFEKGITSVSRISVSENYERMVSDVDLQEAAAWCGGNGSRLTAIRLPKRIAGMFYYIFRKVDRTKGEEFMESLRIGTNLTRNDPIYLLRDKLMTNVRLTDRDKTEAVIRAWNHWCNGQKLSRITITGNIPDIEGYGVEQQS